MNRIVSLACNFPTFDYCNFDDSKSLTDYDAVVIDPNGLSQQFPKYQDRNATHFLYWEPPIYRFRESMKRRNLEISALLDKGKIIISFISPIHNGVLLDGTGRDKRNVDITNYGWLPDGFELPTLIEGEGHSVKLIDNKNPFAQYYYAFKDCLYFSAYLDVISENFRYGSPFITNQTDHVIGFTRSISNGFIAFLPKFPDDNENDNKFEGVIRDILKRKFSIAVRTEAPDWIDNFVIPGTEKLSKRIEELEIENKKLESMKQEVLTERENLEDFNLLLYEQGIPLQDRVVIAFRLMGFHAETVKVDNTDFDVVLESKEGRAIAEVEGRDGNNIHKSKIDQLLSAINQDAETTGTFAKGILIGNHFRKTKPEDRGEAFTETVLNLAKQYKYALISTVNLYFAVINILEHPEDEGYKKSCREKIFNSEGTLVEFSRE